MTSVTGRHEPRLGYFSDDLDVEAFGELYAKVFELRHVGDLYVGDLSPRNEWAHSLVCELIEAVRTFPEDKLPEIFHPHSDILKKRSEVCKIVARAEYDTALFYAPQLRKSDLHGFSRTLTFRDHVQQIENEASICPINRMVVKEGARVAIIGAGPMPLEAIYIYETTGRMVICLDDNKVAVESGRDLFSRLGYDKVITYHHASLGMFGTENPYVIINNSMLNTFRVWETVSSSSYAPEYIAARRGDGIYATIYQSLSPQLVEMMKINLLPGRFVEGTPATMQSTHYADLNASPESAAKMALGGGQEPYQYVLEKLKEEQMRPGSTYLMQSHSWMPN